MKFKDAREAYYTHSGSASTVSRQAAFAGIAIIWIFKIESSGNINLPESLLIPLFFLLLSLSLDLFQYIYSSAAWGIFHFYNEYQKGVDFDGEVYAPNWINFVTNLFFWGKLFSLFIGYTLLIIYSAKSVGFIK